MVSSIAPCKRLYRAKSSSRRCAGEARKTTTRIPSVFFARPGWRRGSITPYAAHIYAFGAEPDGLLWLAHGARARTPLKELLKAQGALPLPRFLPLFEKLCEVVHSRSSAGHRPPGYQAIQCDGDIPLRQTVAQAARHRHSAASSRRQRFELRERRCARRVERTGDRAARVRTPGEDTATTSKMLSTLDDDDSDEISITRGGVSMGSPPYMAPEQWSTSTRADARTDQYALAILAYETLAGRRPFRGSNPTIIAVAHVSKPVPRLGSGFSPDLDEVFARALAKKPRIALPMYWNLPRRFALPLGSKSSPILYPGWEPLCARPCWFGHRKPLADSIALLEAAPTPQRALQASYQVNRASVRLVGVYAVAAMTHLGLEEGRMARSYGGSCANYVASG